MAPKKIKKEVPPLIVEHLKIKQLKTNKKNKKLSKYKKFISKIIIILIIIKLQITIIIIIIKKPEVTLSRITDLLHHPMKIKMILPY
jgi:hypothetical protein